MLKSSIPNVENEGNLKEQSIHIDTLEIENKILKQKNKDLVDELLVKKNEIQDMEASTSLKFSHNSLKEELEEFSQLKVFKCDECSFDFPIENELKVHQKTMHGRNSTKKADLVDKIAAFENKISEQKINLSVSVFQLKDKEIKKVSHCKSYCNRFCRINHQKYTFVKSKGDEIIYQVNNFSKDPKFSTKPEALLFGATRKQYSCNQCEEVFAKQGALKKHKKHYHK